MVIVCVAESQGRESGPLGASMKVLAGRTLDLSRLLTPTITYPLTLVLTQTSSRSFGRDCGRV